MTMSQKGGLWTSVDLLSLEGTELLKADSNPSTFDPDSDLCLRSLLTTGTEKVAIRFIPPSTRYQFIEIDLISSTGVILSVSASTEAQAALGMHGEVVVADLKITPFVLRTYRFPYLGEIESFVFSGFTSAFSVNVKAIRFFTTPDRLVPVVAPETTPSLSVNTAHLTVDAVQVARVGSIYQLDVAAGSTLTTTAVFTFDTLTVSHGLIKVLVSQQNHADVEIDVLDQTGLTTPYQLTSGYAEIFVTGEQKIVSMVFYNLSGAESAHVCVELDNFQAIQPSNAFGTEAGVVVSPLAGILEFICGGGGGGGAVGATGPVGPMGPTGATGPAGAGSVGSGVEFTSSGNFTVPVGVTSLMITAVGGGGAGGGSNNNACGGGGGGAGEMLMNHAIIAVPGAVIPIVIPAVAVGGTGSAAGANGGSVTFNGTQVIALGGDGGTGTSGVPSSASGKGGGPLGGVTRTSNPGNNPASPGLLGQAEAVSYFGGASGGAGAANVAYAGGYGGGAGGYPIGGAGGASASSKAGGGGGAATIYGIGGAGGAGGSNGSAGVNYGTGGGGGGGGGTPTTGGNGAPGYLLIQY